LPLYSDQKELCSADEKLNAILLVINEPVINCEGLRAVCG